MTARPVPAELPGVYPFDAPWWSTARGHGTRRPDPALTLWRGEPAIRCPRCAGPLHVDVGTCQRF